MKQIEIVTKVRSFFHQLITDERINYEIVSSPDLIYNVGSKTHNIASKIIRLRVFDYLPIIKVIKPTSKADYYLSFNRFVQSNVPYIIYVENPTALFHYSINRSQTILGKRMIKKLLNDPNLYGLIFMSNACRDTFKQVCGNYPDNVISKTIYPLVRQNRFADSKTIIQKIERMEKIKLLYIVQGKRFVSKGGPELLEAFSKMSDYADLTIITTVKEISRDLIKKIENNENIELHDFNYTYDELEKIYSKHHIFIQITSDDSFGLTILEAMKAGLAIIATDLYAIPEMVVDSDNGFLISPKYRFFDKKNYPNKDIWNNRKKTIYNEQDIDINIVNQIIKKVCYLYENPDELIKYSLSSLEKSNAKPFSDDYIINQWNNLLK